MRATLLGLAIITTLALICPVFAWPLDDSWANNDHPNLTAPIMYDSGVAFPLPDYANASAFCTAIGHGAAAAPSGNDLLTKNFNSDWTAMAASYVKPYGGTGTSTYPYHAAAAYCGGDWYWMQEYFRSDMIANYSVESIDFSGTPTQGNVPLSVTFISLATGYITGYNWSTSGPGGYWFNSTTAENPIAQFYGVGNYTITHCVSSPNNSACLTKTDYIWGYNDTSQNTLTVTAINGNSGYPIVGANIDLYDVENTSWTNTTASATGSGSITTLTGHTVDAYASATGFASNDKTGIPVSNMYDSVLLFPSGWTNVSAGNATLFVYVYDSANHALPIKGAAVFVASADDKKDGWTNAGGMAQFTIKNETPYLISVSAFGQGYGPATQVTTYSGLGGGSATQTVTFYLSKSTTPTPPITTLPGGGTPTATPTIDPYSQLDSAGKQTYLVDLILQYGPMLVLLFIMATIMGTMKMMGR